MSEAKVPGKERRILYNSDGGNAFCEFWANWRDVDLLRIKGEKGRWRVEVFDAQDMKAIMADSIDEFAAAGIDTLSSVVWYAFKAAAWIVTKAAQDMSDCRTRDRGGYSPLYEAGYDAVQLMIDRCRARGMEFVACFRMNDRHNHGKSSGEFILQHPEWQLKGAPGGPGMNFAYEPVRQKLRDYLEDLLAQYDVDGIEYDYMRWCHMFEPGEGAGHAHLLTDFNRKTRALLDAAAQQRGRQRVVLGVRVPATLKECEHLGFDVETWVKEGLADWVVPTDFHYTDFNTRVEDFAKLAEGTDCKIYPAVHPVICRGNEPGIMRPANYRAAAHNFYAYGADGIEAYNYQYHWGRRQDTARPAAWDANMWPAALGYLGRLRDPEAVSRNDRHYLFHPLWPHPCSTDAIKDDRIVLDRAEPDPQGAQRFRVAEDLSNPGLRAELQFKAVGMALDEALEIQLNGAEVPARLIRHLFDPNGQNKWQGRELDPFYLYVINLDRGAPQPLITHGDNELTVRLIPGGSEKEGTVTIDELELYVYVAP